MSVESMDWLFPQQPYQPFQPAVITWPTITPPTWVDIAEPGTNYHNLIRISDITAIEYRSGELVIKTENTKNYTSGGHTFSDRNKQGFPLYLRSILETIGALHLLTSLKWAEEAKTEGGGE